jgi:hypothetical protein
MNGKIDNLVKHFIGLFNENENRKTGLSRMINKKTIDINENEFKKFISQFSTDQKDGHPWVNPVDILIMSINSIEKVKKQVNLKNCNKFAILWIMCLLSAKCVSSHDHESKLSLEFLSNLGGFQLEDYIYFEKTLLKHLDWRLDISNSDYQRLTDISIKGQMIEVS